MYKKTLFSIISDDGYKVKFRGKNSISLKKSKSAEYFFFFEYLATPEMRVQLDTSGIWLDKNYKTKLSDPAKETELFDRIRELFKFLKIEVE